MSVGYVFRAIPIGGGAGGSCNVTYIVRNSGKSVLFDKGWPFCTAMAFPPPIQDHQLLGGGGRAILHPLPIMGIALEAPHPHPLLAAGLHRLGRSLD